jgi:hypothetical protein
MEARGTSTYTYNGNTIIEDYAGLVKYTATLDNTGNIVKKIAEFITDPTQNYTEEWLDYDDKPITNEPPPSGCVVLHSKNNFHKSKLTFTDWDKQGIIRRMTTNILLMRMGIATETKAI